MQTLLGSGFRQFHGNNGNIVVCTVHYVLREDHCHREMSIRRIVLGQSAELISLAWSGTRVKRMQRRHRCQERYSDASTPHSLRWHWERNSTIILFCHNFILMPFRTVNPAHTHTFPVIPCRTVSFAHKTCLVHFHLRKQFDASQKLCHSMLPTLKLRTLQELPSMGL